MCAFPFPVAVGVLRPHCALVDELVELTCFVCLAACLAVCLAARLVSVSAIAYSLLSFANSSLPSSSAALSACAQPVITSFLEYMCFGTVLNLWQIAGIGLVVMGLYANVSSKNGTKEPGAETPRNGAKKSMDAADEYDGTELLLVDHPEDPQGSGAQLPLAGFQKAQQLAAAVVAFGAVLPAAEGKDV
jgi:hypothetical protein